MTNDEIIREIERLSREVNILKGSNMASMGPQSVISGDATFLGQTAIRFPIIYALSTGANPTDADANGVFMNAFGETWDDGTTLWQLGGVNNGSLQFGLKSTDGAAYFSGGQGTIDSNGINLNGIMYALRHYAEDPTGTIKRYGRFEMLYPDGKTVPALALTFQDAAVSSELVVNGGFETGDFTGWSKGASSTVISATSHIGTYCANVIQYEVLSQNSISVLPSSNYLFSSYTNGNTLGHIKIEIKWYDAGSVLIRTDSLYDAAPKSGWQNITSALYSPPLSSTCSIVITDGVYTVLVDDVSLQSISLVRKLLFTPDLEYMDGSTYRKVLSGKKELYPPLAPTIALVATASGNCTNGAHLCKTTFVDADGETESSAASNSVTVDGTHKQLTCTLEVGPWGTTSRNIYMTEAGGTTYKLVGTQADNTTTSYTVNVADGSLTTVAPVVNLSGTRPLFPQTLFVTGGSIITSNATLTANLTGYFLSYNTSAANANNGDYFIFNDIYLKSGTYTIDIVGAETTSSGNLDWYVDNVKVISNQDWYGTTNPNNRTSTGVSIVGDGVHSLKAVVNGKNGSSGDYRFAIYNLLFIRTGA
jgi:hypothetical protein